eukprot:939016_1
MADSENQNRHDPNHNHANVNISSQPQPRQSDQNSTCAASQAQPNLLGEIMQKCVIVFQHYLLHRFDVHVNIKDLIYIFAVHVQSTKPHHSQMTVCAHCCVSYDDEQKHLVLDKVCTNYCREGKCGSDHSCKRPQSQNTASRLNPVIRMDSDKAWKKCLQKKHGISPEAHFKYCWNDDVSLLYQRHHQGHHQGSTSCT